MVGSGLFSLAGNGTSLLGKRAVVCGQRLAKFVPKNCDSGVILWFHDLEVFEVLGSFSGGIAEHSYEFGIAAHEFLSASFPKWTVLRIPKAAVSCLRG